MMKLGMMRSSDLSEQERMKYLSNLYELIARMKWLIETMLNLSRIEAEAVRFAKETASCSKLIEQSIDTVSVTAELNGVEIIAKLGGDPEFIVDFHDTSAGITIMDSGEGMNRHIFQAFLPFLGIHEKRIRYRACLQRKLSPHRAEA